MLVLNSAIFRRYRDTEKLNCSAHTQHSVHIRWRSAITSGKPMKKVYKVVFSWRNIVFSFFIPIPIMATELVPFLYLFVLDITGVGLYWEIGSLTETSDNLSTGTAENNQQCYSAELSPRPIREGKLGQFVTWLPGDNLITIWALKPPLLPPPPSNNGIECLLFLLRQFVKKI